jgi:hypothetical protein
MFIETKLHTMFILVGPSMCGKSSFAQVLKNRLVSAGKMTGINYNVSVVSSDEHRISLTGNPDKYAPENLEVSEQAFDQLYSHIKAVTTYPVNHEFVIVDTTGLSDVFRDDMRAIAQKAGYRVELIVFNYSERDARRFCTNDQWYDVCYKQYIRLRKDVLSNMSSRLYNHVTTIKTPGNSYWEDLNVAVEDAELYAKCHLQVRPDRPVYIIGDIHEHTTALQELLMKFDRGDVILVGDYLDKGGDTENVLNAVYKLAKAGAKIAIGNHESYVVRRLRDQIEPAAWEIEKRYMTSLTVLQERPDLQAMLFDIYDNHSVPFVKIHGKDSRTIYVTHAPCKNEVIGKLSVYAMRGQRNLYYDRSITSDDYRHKFEFIFQEAQGNQPLHVFGHVAHASDKLVYRNKVFLDTGAVYGNKLTAMRFLNNQYEFISVDAEARTKKIYGTTVLQDNLTKPLDSDRAFTISDFKLTPSEERYVNNIPRFGTKYISGTMPPAAAIDDGVTMVLEGVNSALNYYSSKGVKKIVIEPKYMGSRCQIYLFKGDPSASKAVSRAGYVISEQKCPGITELLKCWYKKVFEDKAYISEDIKFDVEGVDNIIIDGELLPWSALGESLIVEQFIDHILCVSKELTQLADYQEELNHLDFDARPDIKERLIDANKFGAVIEEYAGDIVLGKETPLEFKPFSILSINDKVDIPFTESARFRLFNPDEILCLDLEDLASWKMAEDFFHKCTVEKRLEGVVVKPEEYVKGIIPYMKVRNEEYLRIVYGYDYKHRYAEHCKKKRIESKSSLAIREYEIGRSMLQSSGDNELKFLAARMVGQLKLERSLDPRL